MLETQLYAPPPPTTPIQPEKEKPSLVKIIPDPQLTVAKAPEIEDSGIAIAFRVLAYLEIIAAPIAGFLVGDKNAMLGWLVFLAQ